MAPAKSHTGTKVPGAAKVLPERELVIWVSEVTPALSSWRDAAGTRAMRDLSRELLGRAAQHCGAPSGPFDQDDQGVPQALEDFHWAVAHSRGCCAAWVGKGERIGLDMERLDRPYSQNIRERLAQLGAAPEDLSPASRCMETWTRVEATLKWVGCGLGGLAQIRIDAETHHNYDLRSVRYGDEHFWTRLAHSLDSVVCAALPAGQPFRLVLLSP